MRLGEDDANSSIQEEVRALQCSPKILDRSFIGRVLQSDETYWYLKPNVTRKNIGSEAFPRKEIGFKWSSTRYLRNVRSLEPFKKRFGHCDAPFRYSSDLLLGLWCNKTRHADKQIQQGKTAKGLNQDRIGRDRFQMEI